MAEDMENEPILYMGQPITETTVDGIYDMDVVRYRRIYDVGVGYHERTQPGD